MASSDLSDEEQIELVTKAMAERKYINPHRRPDHDDTEEIKRSLLRNEVTLTNIILTINDTRKFC